MTVTVQTTPPTLIVAGDTVAFTITLSDYAAPTWDLTWALAGPSGAIEVTATDDDTAHAVALTTTQTAALAAGSYQWRLRATDGSTVRTVETGVLTVGADVAALRPGEAATYEETQLPIVEAAITAIVSGEVQSYMIAGRQWNALDLSELRAWRQDLKRAITRQQHGGQLPPVIVGRWKSANDSAGWE